MRGATFLELRFYVPVLYFNPRSREGSDRQIFKIIFYLIISIHAPVRGATSLPNLIVHSVPNFNPRSREGSDSLICNLSSKKEISIHAPVRGATGLSKKSRQYRNISIHAPVRGATLECFSFLVGINNFNPRSREGSDFSWHDFNSFYKISIHAPVRGATISNDSLKKFWEFQSTLPWGERQRRLYQTDRAGRISIHAPVRGATGLLLPEKGLNTYFNPRSREGSDEKPPKIFGL